MTSRVRIAAVVLALLAATFAAFVVAVVYLMPTHTGPHIDAVENAAADGRFTGMTAQEAGTYLGATPSDYNYSGWDVTYRLGDERGFISIDSEWLVLRLDADGRVAEASVVAD